MHGDDLTRWTVRLALAGYVIALAILLRARRPSEARFFEKAGLLPSKRIARRAWTAGCGLMWIHVACAFHFYHHWSHAAAQAHTGRETASVVGVDWGGGIYFNYLFLLLWSADVCWWWLGAASYDARPVTVTRLLHGYLAFIAFNATVVFESGMIRYVGLAVTVFLVFLFIRAHRDGKGRT